MKHTFGRKERLKSRKAIQALFADGRTLKSFPLRLIYRMVRIDAQSGEPRYRATVSVPARLHRKATKRNLFKRRMREAYRRNKHILQSTKTIPVDLLFIYTNRQESSYAQIEEATIKLLHQLDRLRSQQDS